MKKIVSLFILALVFSNLSYAVKAYPGLISYQQPDGSLVKYYLVGDENYSYMVSEDGYLLSYADNGFLVYGDLCENNEIIKPSKKRVKAFSVSRQLDSLSKVRIGKLYSPQKRASNNVGYPVTGSPKSLVILVNFSDVKFKSSTATQDFIDLLNKYNYTNNGGTGSARDYFRNASNGVFEPDFVVVGPYDLPENMKYYGEEDKEKNSHDKRPGNLIVDACAAADKDVDFNEFDVNGDGYVDNIFVYYAGHNQAEGGGTNTIWPHRSYIVSEFYFDGVRLGDYACTSELKGSTGNYMCGIGTFVHEFGHVISLPDLYDTQYSGHKTLGSWDVMDNGSYNNGGRTPPTYSAYERFYLGWMTPKQLKDDMKIELQPISISNSAYIVAASDHNLDGANPNPTEFFMLENRHNVNNDGVMAGGLLITRIKYSARKWSNNVVNNNPQDMGVEICCAASDTDQPTLNIFPGGRRVTDFTFTMRNGSVLSKSLSQITREDGNIVSFLYGEPTSLPVIEVVTDDDLEDFNAMLGEEQIKQVAISARAIDGDLNINVSGDCFSMRLANSNDDFVKNLSLKANADSLVEANLEIKYISKGYTFRHYVTETISLSAKCFEKNIILKARTPRPVYVLPPVACEAENITPYTFTAVWDTVFDATEYMLSVYNVENNDTTFVLNNKVVKTTDSNKIKLDVVNLLGGTTYKYRVKASDKDLYGRYENVTDYSNEISVTTLPGFGIESRKLDILKDGDNYKVYLPIIDDNFSIFIYSLDGQLISTVPVLSNIVELPMLASNKVYILKYTSNDGIQRKSKVIKLYYE
jgi:M6 family metalloprotease-like protein